MISLSWFSSKKSVIWHTETGLETYAVSRCETPIEKIEMIFKYIYSQVPSEYPRIFKER